MNLRPQSVLEGQKNGHQPPAVGGRLPAKKGSWVVTHVGFRNICVGFESGYRAVACYRDKESTSASVTALMTAGQEDGPSVASLSETKNEHVVVQGPGERGVQRTQPSHDHPLQPLSESNGGGYEAWMVPVERFETEVRAVVGLQSASIEAGRDLTVSAFLGRPSSWAASCCPWEPAAWTSVGTRQGRWTLTEGGADEITSARGRVLKKPRRCSTLTGKQGLPETTATGGGLDTGRAAVAAMGGCFGGSPTSEYPIRRPAGQGVFPTVGVRFESSSARSLGMSAAPGSTPGAVQAATLGLGVRTWPPVQESCRTHSTDRPTRDRPAAGGSPTEFRD